MIGRFFFPMILGLVLLAGPAFCPAVPHQSDHHDRSLYGRRADGYGGRLVAKAMSDSLKAQMIIENVGGAGGTIGAARVARAAPTATRFSCTISANRPPRRSIASCLMTRSTTSSPSA